MGKYLKIYWIVLWYSLLHAQSNRGVIRGVITDFNTKMPLQGVVVALKMVENVLYAYSDSLGRYEFTTVVPGRFEISATRVGYSAFAEKDLLLLSNKEFVFDMELRPKWEELQEVSVTGQKHDQLSLGERTFTVEQTQRTAGVFFDPARMVTAYPGVISSKDFGNDVVVRGNSPAGVLWRIEGADVLNPNHLTNGSTPNERISPSGGGVNILSGQMMQQSKFLMGAHSAGYGNALSGIFDIKLRRGNDKTREYTAQASLIGIDVAAEGPFSKRGGASYLINYRYSTLGLMALMGLDFGGQTFGFQDLSANFSIPLKKMGHLTFFGFGGVSENVFKVDTLGWKDKSGPDKTGFNFYSNMYAIGSTYQVKISKNMLLRHVVCYSSQESDNNSKYFLSPQQFRTRYIDNYHSGLLFASSALRATFGLRHELEVGMQHRLQSVYAYSFTTRNIYTGGFESYTMTGATFLLQAYIHDKWQVSERIQTDIGVHVNYLHHTQKWTPDPRIVCTWAPVASHAFSLAYSIVSQTQPIALYFLPNRRAQLPNKSLDFTRAHHAVLGYNYRFGTGYKLRAEAYYQHLYQVPVSTHDSTFSMINFLQGLATDTSLINAGTATNKGIELSLERSMQKGYYFLISGSLYESTYKARNGEEKSTAFNGNFMGHFLGGKEWSWEGKKGKHKQIGINLRVFLNGGFRNTSIDTKASAEAGVAVLKKNTAFDVRLPNYFRTDVRVYFRIHGNKASHLFSLDVWNMTNYQNIAVVYFDASSNDMRYKPALPFYPNVSYRIEF